MNAFDSVALGVDENQMLAAKQLEQQLAHMSLDEDAILAEVIADDATTQAAQVFSETYISTKVDNVGTGIPFWFFQLRALLDHVDRIITVNDKW